MQDVIKMKIISIEEAKIFGKNSFRPVVPFITIGGVQCLKK